MAGGGKGEKKAGLAAALDSVGGGGALPAELAAGEQMSLIETPAAGDEAPAQAAARGPGRPPGAANRSTKEFAEFFLTQNEDPILFLGKIYQAKPADLVKKFGVKLEDALKFQIAAAKICADYVRQKMPVAVQVDAKGVVSLTVDLGGGGVGEIAAGDGAVIIEGEEVESENDAKSNT